MMNCGCRWVSLSLPLVGVDLNMRTALCRYAAEKHFPLWRFLSVFRFVIACQTPHNTTQHISHFLASATGVENPEEKPKPESQVIHVDSSNGIPAVKVLCGVSCFFSVSKLQNEHTPGIAFLNEKSFRDYWWCFGKVTNQRPQ